MHDRFLFRYRTPSVFLLRSSARRYLHWEFTGKKPACEHIETRKFFEQTVQLTNPDTGEILFARRITVILDKPTRDRDHEIHILTNLPKKTTKTKTIGLVLPTSPCPKGALALALGGETGPG